MSKSLIIIFVVVLVMGVVVWKFGTKQEASLVPAPQEEISITPEQEPLTRVSCVTVGGYWNECGSACRETPDEPCIQVCVSYCECTNDTQCPAGYACGGFVQGTGVCQPIL